MEAQKRNTVKVPLNLKQMALLHPVFVDLSRSGDKTGFVIGQVFDAGNGKGFIEVGFATALEVKIGMEMILQKFAVDVVDETISAAEKKVE
jgi:hypothetical protein